MKLEIDTSRDSKEEIQKAIHLLLSLLGHSPQRTNASDSRNIFETGTQQSEPSVAPTSSTVFGNLFDSSLSQPTPEQPKKPKLEYY